jgi:hypothetical protein
MQRELLASIAPLLEPWLLEIHDRLLRYVRDAGWPDAETEARLLFAQIDGVSQHFVLDPAHYPLETVINQLIRQYEHPSRPGSAVERPRRSTRRRA